MQNKRKPCRCVLPPNFTNPDQDYRVVGVLETQPIASQPYESLPHGGQKEPCLNGAA